MKKRNRELSLMNIEYKKIYSNTFEVYIFGFVYRVMAKNSKEARSKAYRIYTKENLIKNK